MFGRCPFVPALILNLHLRHFNMRGASFFERAHHFVARDNTFIEAKTVSGMFTKSIRQEDDMLQINFHNNYGNRTTGAIRHVPNASTRFTGRTEVIAKLKRHFFPNTKVAVQKRKYFLLYGMGGIGKTQICLKFVEEMNNR